MNASGKAAVKLAFHDADTNTDADTDILAEILARMSVSVSAWWNASFTEQHFDVACITGPQPNHGPLQFYPSRLQSLADPGGGLIWPWPHMTVIRRGAVPLARPDSVKIDGK